MYPRDPIESQGLTLIELMITLAVSVTTHGRVSVDHVSYATQRRGDAYGALLDLATREEHYYNTYESYTDGIVAPAECRARAATSARAM